MAEPEPKTLRCSLPGDLISTTAPAFRETLDTLLSTDSLADQPLVWLEIDMRAARFIDSVGINLLVLTLRALEAQKAKMRLLITSKNLLRVLTFTRLTDYVEVVLQES